MESTALLPSEFRVGDTVVTDFGTITLLEIETVDNGHTVRQLMTGLKPNGDPAQWSVTVRNHHVPSFQPTRYEVTRQQ